MKKKNIPLFIIEMVALYVAYFILLFLIHKYLRGLSRISTGYEERFWIAYQVPVWEKIFITIVSVFFTYAFSKIVEFMNIDNPSLVHILSGVILIFIIVIYKLCFVFVGLPISSFHALTALNSMAIGGVLQIAEGIRIRLNS